MNNDPLGTPNPLNPTPGSGTPTTSPSGPNLNTQPLQNGQPEPVGQPETNTKATTNPVTTQTRTIGSLDPTGRKMEQVPNFTNATPKKKKKTGLVVGIIIAVLIICGGIAGAIWWVNTNSYNPVEKALIKALDSKTSSYATISGSAQIESTAQDQSSFINKLTVKYTANIDGSEVFSNNPAFASDIDATITAFGESFGEISANIKVIYTKNNDLYLKLDGLAESISAMLLSSVATNCINSTNANCTDGTPLLVAAFGSIFTDIDGVWLKLSADDLGDLTLDVRSYDNAVGCVANLMNESASSTTIVDTYKENRFIGVSTKNLPVASNGNALYKVNIDAQNLTNFMNSMSNTNFMYNIYSCLNISNTGAVTVNEVKTMLANMPEIYAEVGKNDQFSRIYTHTYIEDSNLDIITDFTVSYPDKLNIAEPRNANAVNLIQTFDDVVKKLQGLDKIESTDIPEITEKDVQEIVNAQ